MEDNIIEIESEIQQLEQQLKKQHDAKKRQRLNDLQKAFRTEYLRIKGVVIACEATNNDRFYIIHSNNGFKKLFANSALMFYDAISPKLNISPRILPDSDHSFRSTDGVMSLKWTEKLRSRLEALGCHYDEERSFPGLMVYISPWPYRDKDLRRLKTHNSMFISSFEKTIIPNNLYPTLFLRLSELNRLIYEITRNNHDDFFRRVYGEKFALLSSELVFDYLAFSNQSVNKDKLTALLSLSSKLEHLKFYSKVIADLNIWTPNVLGRLGDSFKTCETLLQDIIFKLQQDEQKCLPKK